MRILDARFVDDISDAVNSIIIDLGVEPREVIPGLMVVIRDQLEKLRWDVQGQAWDEAIALLEDEDGSLDEGE